MFFIFNKWYVLACVLLSAKVMSMLIPADQFLSINSGDKREESMIQCSVASIAKSPTDNI